MPRPQKSGLLTGGAFSKLKTMPQYPEVILRLERGDSFYSVAKWLKAEKLFKTIKLKSLARQISRFWVDYKAAKVTAPAQSTAMVPVSEDAPVIDREEAIAEIKGLEELAETQKSRLDMAHENEKTVKFLFPGVRHEVAELRTLYHTLIDKKSALGVYDGPVAAPTSITNVQLNVENIDQRQAIAVLNNPSSRRKILSAIKNAGALVAEDVGDDRRVVVTDRKRGIIDVEQDDAAGND